jgi:hypothetical protein
MPGAEREPADEVALVGGLANVGKVVRVGDTVRRPPTPSSAAVHSLLVHLEAIGFDGSPRFLGLDDRGRSVLTYVDGDVAVPPYPAWAADEALLVSVADLLRRYHEAVRSFPPSAAAVWNTTLAAPGPAADVVIGHNDLCLENVVCRAGRAVAFIDFDFAAPVDRWWDVAVAARHWVPVRDRTDLDVARSAVDQVDRFRRFLDSYGAEAGDRPTVVGHARVFLAQALERMRERAEAGLPGYVEAWAAGYEGQNRRAQAWLADHADRLTR